MPNGHDKNYIRLCAAIDGFRTRYGRWPARVRIFPAALANLRDDVFTAVDFARITAKVALVPDDAPMIAEDDTGASYDYGREGFPLNRPTPCAAEWLGVTPKPDPHGLAEETETPRRGVSTRNEPRTRKPRARTSDVAKSRLFGGWCKAQGRTAVRPCRERAAVTRGLCPSGDGQVVGLLEGLPDRPTA
jgi:hypothetical protein